MTTENTDWVLENYGKDWVARFDNGGVGFGTTSREKQQLSDLFMMSGYGAEKAIAEVKKYERIMTDIQIHAFNRDRINKAILSGNDGWLMDLISTDTLGPLRDMQGNWIQEPEMTNEEYMARWKADIIKAKASESDGRLSISERVEFSFFVIFMLFLMAGVVGFVILMLGGALN